ncbi:MAG: DEAD/DEAH box helicase [Thermoleophilia bacterium]
MTVKLGDLTAVDAHWAVVAFGEEERDRLLSLAEDLAVKDAVGRQMHLGCTLDSNDQRRTEMLAAAYEIAALEGLDALLDGRSDEEGLRLQAQAQAGAHRAYGLLRVIPEPSTPEDTMLRTLRLGAFAYCSDRWTDLRRYLAEPSLAATSPLAAGDWDKRVLAGVYSAWVSLLRKRDWNDLNSVADAVSILRSEQDKYEAHLLEGTDSAAAEGLALRLLALYHWARATELLGQYMIQGQPRSIDAELDKHFEAAAESAMLAGDFELEMVLRWLHIAARKMTSGSVWWVAHTVNSRVTQFVTHMTKSQGMFELLPPQRAAIREQGLLDQAARAVVVDLPTSGGKTVLAEFRMLQALNQFVADGGWIAYVAPTRALVAQITRRLRSHLDLLGVRVEQLSGAVEVDAFEEELLGGGSSKESFDVLVSTPEKLQFVIRNKKVARPLVLLVVDEAHNLEDEARGLRIELLIATVKRDCQSAAFLLLMPNVPNADDLTRWLDPDSGKTISLSTSAWQPNDRIVGVFHAASEPARRGDWQLRYKTVITDPGTTCLSGEHRVGAVRPLDISFAKARATLSAQAVGMAAAFSDRGTSIAVGSTVPNTWSMAKLAASRFGPFDDVPDDIQLVQQYLRNEIGPDYELVDLLGCGVAVHHSALSDEARTMIEWLAEHGSLRVLCATTTIAQGINFPVSSVFLASRKYPYGKEMSHRAFWNLAGRAGRIGHDSVGVVGLAAGTNPVEVERYIGLATENLVSRLVSLLDELEQAGRLNDLELVIEEDQWSDFRCYVAHLWNEKRSLDAVLAETEQLLRNTFGYGYLRSRSTEQDRAKAKLLLDATRGYARKLSQHPENAVLADATGFSPEGVSKALLGLQRLDRKLTKADWEPTSLFDSSGSSLPALIGVMMRLPSIGQDLETIGSHGTLNRRIADIAQAWVGGESIQAIADGYFTGNTSTDRIGLACKAIYKVLANSGTWGLAALSKMPTAGFDVDKLTEDEIRRINSAAAMLYHGVNTEAGVLMRMNSAPRTVAGSLGAEFVRQAGEEHVHSVAAARAFLARLDDSGWSRARPTGATMSGHDYRRVWQVLSGVSTGNAEA